MKILYPNCILAIHPDAHTIVLSAGLLANKLKTNYEPHPYSLKGMGIPARLFKNQLGIVEFYKS